MLVGHSMGGMSDHGAGRATTRSCSPSGWPGSRSSPPRRARSAARGCGPRCCRGATRSPAALGLVARAQPALVEGARQAHRRRLIWAVTGSVAYGDRNVAPWLVDLVDAMIRVNAVDALTDFVDTLGSHNRIAALPALATCEVLVLAGDADRVIPVSHSERIAAELPEARAGACCPASATCRCWSSRWPPTRRWTRLRAQGGVPHASPRRVRRRA